MALVKCRLVSYSRSAHLHQIYTGFAILHSEGVIDLTQLVVRKTIDYEHPGSHLLDAGHAHLDAVLNEHVRVHFDTHDAMEIPLSELEECDFYFKRSYSPLYVQRLPASQRSKVFPLGLNYQVLPNFASLHAAKRALQLAGSFRERAAGIRQAMDICNLLRFEPRLRHMEALPDFKTPPKVLFLVGCYDPHEDPTRTSDKIEERMRINEIRANCIRLLRKELGSRFHGGFSRSAFALAHYSDLVVPETEKTDQHSFLQKFKEHSICVASMGLHGSNGWKLAEYVAHSKAIVSEKLHYWVPGNFVPERNYLEFSTAEGCVEAAVELMNNRELRNELMTNNALYYRSYLRPDSLVACALLTALRQSSRESAERIRSRLRLAQTTSASA